jgi:hypothetical protein
VSRPYFVTHYRMTRHEGSYRHVRLGCYAVPAKSGKQALAKLLRAKPGLVMPDLEYLTAARNFPPGAQPVELGLGS